MWDVFLVEGVDFLLRTALAILRLNEQELLACESIPALYVALESLPTRMWLADKLLQVSKLLTSTVNIVLTCYSRVRLNCDHPYFTRMS